MRQILITLLGLNLLSCQSQPSISNEEMEYRKELVQKIGEAFEKSYVFPEVGFEVKGFLQNQFSKNVYSQETNYDSLAKRLTKDIQGVTNDKHVLIYNIKPKPTDTTYEEGRNVVDFYNSFPNFGLKDSLLQDGDIGYLDISIFYHLDLNPKASEVAQNIMQKFKDTNTIIFDLRNCKGGDPGMLNTILAYLYPKGAEVHTNSFYYRPQDTTFNSYTMAEVKGRTYPEKPIIVLTSTTTFSCGEEFAYDIQQLKRGTLIGETTGGGAHTIEPRKIDEKFEVILPTGRAINPISKTNWEGVGVKPDLVTKREDALKKALEMIKRN